jgi:hypothetical protein
MSKEIEQELFSFTVKAGNAIYLIKAAWVELHNGSATFYIEKRGSFPVASFMQYTSFQIEEYLG